MGLMNTTYISAAAENLEEAVEGVSTWWNDPATRELVLERPLSLIHISEPTRPAA